MKWNWKDLKGANLSKARTGPISLEVWFDDDEGWIVAFDLSNGDEIASAYINKRFPSKEKAKAAAETLAKKWLEKLDKARKK